MRSNIADERKELLHCLSKAARRRSKSKMVRVITSPSRMIYPKLAGIAGMSDRVQAHTFWGGTMKVILPEIVSTNIWRYGFFEEEVCRYMLHHLRRGMTFIDIGAHVGFFSLLGGYLVRKEGRVLAFEPTPNTYGQLAENIRRFSPFPNVQTFNCAAYSEETELQLQDYGVVDSAYNSAFGSRKMKGSSSGVNLVVVNARRIDDVLREQAIQNVHLIKIDAESSEMQVLMGLRETLKQCRPSIIMEVGDFGFDGVPKSSEIIRWLQQMNYCPYETCDGLIVRHQLREHYNYGNLLLVADR